MALTPAFEVDGVFSCGYDPAAKAIVGTWKTFLTDDVRGIVTRHAEAGRRFGAKTCIVDVSGLRSVLAPADAAWVETKASALVHKAGMTTLVNVIPASAIVKMGADRWSRAATADGIAIYTTGSVADALALASKVAIGKVA